MAAVEELTTRATCRSWRAGTCGCTSRTWAPTTRRTRSRSSSAARAATSSTSTAAATSTGSPRCSASTSATAAPTSPRPAPTRRRELGFFTNWSYAHPKAIELAARIARPRAGRPQPRVLHLRRLGGGRLGAQALPPVPQAHGQRRALQGHLAQARLPRHDDGRADRDRHPRRAARRSSRCFPGSAHVPNTNAYRPEVDDPAEAIRDRIEFEGPETVSCVILEPVQNSGGCFGPAGRLLPARPRDLRRVRDPVHLRRGHLLVGPARRVVRRRALRLRARHHHDGQGPDLVVRADGRGDRLRPRLRAVRRRHEHVRARHHVRRAPGRRGGRAGQPRRVRGRRACSTTCAANEGRVRGDARVAARHPDRRRRARHGLLLGDRAGHATRRRRRPSPRTSATGCCATSSRRELFRRGLICRADDRGDPVIQLSPPLIAGPGAVRGDPAPCCGRRSRRRRGGSRCS